MLCYALHIAGEKSTKTIDEERERERRRDLFTYGGVGESGDVGRGWGVRGDVAILHRGHERAVAHHRFLLRHDFFVGDLDGDAQSDLCVLL